jgi:hypothetical protein
LVAIPKLDSNGPTACILRYLFTMVEILCHGALYWPGFVKGNLR